MASKRQDTNQMAHNEYLDGPNLHFDNSPNSFSTFLAADNAYASSSYVFSMNSPTLQTFMQRLASISSTHTRL